MKSRLKAFFAINWLRVSIEIRVAITKDNG